LVKLFLDLSTTFRWICYAHIPTSGDGAVKSAPAASPSGAEIFNANLGDFKNLLEEYQHISLEQVMAFASWFMGDLTQKRELCANGNMKIKRSRRQCCRQ
jgi:hypothetical protein